MAKFIFKKKTPKFVISEVTQLINGMSVVVAPSKRIEVKNGILDTAEFVKKNPSFTEEEVAGRIRRDSKFNTAEIREISAADERAIAIRNKKMKEAEEEINKFKAENK